MPVTTPNLPTNDLYRELVLPALYARSVALANTGRIETTATTIYVPKATQGNASWVAEGAVIPDDGSTIASDAITPKKTAAIATISNETVSDTAGDGARMVGELLTRSVAKKIDAAWFDPTPDAGAPVGLAGWSGLTSTTLPEGPTGSLKGYATAIGLLEGAGNTASVIYMNPADWGTLLQLGEGTGADNKPVLLGQSSATGARTIFGVPVVTSPAVTAGVVFVVDGSAILSVVRSDGSVAFDSSEKFSADSQVARVVSRVAWAFPVSGAAVKISV